MTDSITSLPAAVAARGALPMPAGPARPIAALDVDLHLPQQRIARQRVEASVERLRWLLAHSDEAPKQPAPAGELAEYRHLLYDADEDAAVPAFPYPTPLETP
ncbi:hypothetical protein [Streptomyces sp. NPDC048252]|uniref:hypothetical protein n=1 Tax=Streptomyces sp. NPDC048252 TaxID=3154612 RepID=UPI003446AEA0